MVRYTHPLRTYLHPSNDCPDELALGSEYLEDMPFCDRPRKPRPLIPVFRQRFVRIYLKDAVADRKTSRSSCSYDFVIEVFHCMSCGAHREGMFNFPYVLSSNFMMSNLDDESDPGNRC